MFFFEKYFLNVKKDWLSGIGGTSGDIH